MMETLDNGGGRVAVGRAYHGSIPVNFIFYQLYEINCIENTRKKKKDAGEWPKLKNIGQNFYLCIIWSAFALSQMVHIITIG